jgi:deoxyribodipyrimidine photo-lyase
MNAVIVWFRRDLRLSDQPALQAAAAQATQVIPVYIHSPDELAPWAPGAASRWWLHHSLTALDAGLRARRSQLIVRRGPSLEALVQLAAETGASTVFWNCLYEPHAQPQDSAIVAALQRHGLSCSVHHGTLLHRPERLLKQDGSPYRVFTAFWKALQPHLPTFAPLPAPPTLPLPAPAPASLPLASLGLLPRIRWDETLRAAWQPGEAHALDCLGRFVRGPQLARYQHDRDIPGQPGTSRLSPHLHFGELSPHQILWAHHQAVAQLPGAAAGADAWLRELAWREFAHYVLHHFPATTDHPMDGRFAQFPWRGDYDPLLGAWQRGETGFPIIDAGMRELWQTGFMHNRVRMLVASLLTKHLRIPWQEGARWFWDTLVDADLANNTLGWQWTAGCGVDAAPYFRIFNPLRQSEKFDPEARYLRRWLPQLCALPNQHIHAPWLAPSAVLAQAGVDLGSTYPRPILDLDRERQTALAAFAAIKATPRNSSAHTPSTA